MSAQRFLFFSLPTSGHMDFGGMSYLRAARALRARGCAVSWAFTRSEGVDERPALHAALKEAGIPVSSLDREGINLRLRVAPSPEELKRDLAGLRRVARHLRRRRIDVLVADRRSVLAAAAARLAGIPWAAVGTDGARWRHEREPAFGIQQVRHGTYVNPASSLPRLCGALGIADLDEECFRSEYLSSPFLTLSFFPKRFFAAAGAVRVPPVAHFLGAGGRAGGAPEERRRVIVSMGNTFHPHARGLLLEFVARLAAGLPETPILLLTGPDRAVHEVAAGLLKHEPSVEVARWRAYEECFPTARLVIGHGGSAVLWGAMYHGIPFIAMDPVIGDQWFHSRQIRRLGLGKVIVHGRIAGVDAAKTVSRTLGDSRILRSVEGMRRVLLSGGGAEAAADLLQTLAREKRPVIRCGKGRCCC